jgi:acetyl esterase/lipase
VVDRAGGERRRRARRRAAVVGAVVLAAALLTGCPTPPPTGCDGPTVVTRDVRYRSVPAGVDPGLLSLDVHRPGADCRHAGALIWVHGGGWATGDKAGRMPDKVALAAGAEMVLVSVNYRLSDGSGPTPVRWPVHPDDVAAAVAWVVAHAAEIGVATDRIVLAGHSAGAGIVAEVGTDARYLAPHGLAPTDLACVAPLDTEAYDVPAAVAQGGSTEAIYRNAFGDDPATWRAASPIHQVGTTSPSPRWFFARRGTAERRALSDRFAGALGAAGATTTSITLTGYSHEDVNVRLGEPGESQLTPPFVAFLDGCTAPRTSNAR